MSFDRNHRVTNGLGVFAFAYTRNNGFADNNTEHDGVEKYQGGLAFIKCSRSGKKTRYGTFSYPSLRTHEGIASVHARRRVGPLDILPEAKLGQSLEGQLGIRKVPVLHRLGVENGSRKVGSRRNYILQIRIVHGRILEGSPANVGSRKVRSYQVRLVESTALQVASCKIGHLGKD